MRIGVAVVVVVLAGATLWLRRAEQVAQAERRQARRAAERAVQLSRRDRLGAESAGLMPTELDGLRLGSTLSDVRSQRSAMTPRLDRPDPLEPDLTLYEEALPRGARAVYAFDEGRLGRVQVMSLLPDARAIAPHLHAMLERYGRPTGVWDCPHTGGVPTRRFTWRRAHATVMDVFLLHRRVSVTLYIAKNASIHRSLQRARCRPVAPEALGRFPRANLTPEPPEPPPRQP